MKRQSFSLVAILSLLFVATGCTAQEKAPELKDLKDKVSYSIGLDIGRNFKAQGVEVEPALLLKGMKDALADAQPMLTDEQIEETMTAFQQQMMEKQQKMISELAETNKKEGQVFLAENAKKEGVVSLPSGLQYKVVSAGEGASPKAEDTVSVHYRGTLVDGTEFDSSYSRGEPATFPVNGVIPGWTEALQLMKKGAKYELYIPAELAYGQRGAGPAIGPNATLIFEVELLEIEPK
ncbi:FKBP-type peptidyl-prolyl cis-trans isomerase [Desulfuromonas sp. AOP6]|uniref:FKBP-type peptidyl-prolyl cis-trans isomerase n=1 Tax=Desulfuromonas sp. AOP6 TaxID=1566351 RepID=UPI00127F21BD|nr:FKBP-type peptidyl-prolyl cis-trans isomerase [Desulfuromonas sp. AOP6]BCA80625.1 outer membrane protein MIP [Desulfuromonas sp. AOP6]